MGKGSFQLKRLQGVVLLHFPHLLNELLNDSPENFKAVVREVKKRCTNRPANLRPINPKKESKWAAIAAHIAELSNNLLQSADQLSETERKTVKRVIERVQKDCPKRFVIALALCLAQSPEDPVTRATIVEVLVPLLSGAGPRGKKISIIDLDSFKCSSFFIEMSCAEEGEKAVEDAGEYMHRVLMGNQTLNELTGVRSKDGRWVVVFVNSGKLAPHQPSTTSSGKRLCEDYTFVDPRNFGTGGRGGGDSPPSPDADSGLFFKFFPAAKGDAPETKMQKGFGARSTGKFLNQDSLSNHALDYLAQKLLSNSPVPVLFVRAYGQYECDYTLAALIEDIADKFFPPSEEEAKPDIEINANDSDYLVLLLRWQEEAPGSITFRQVLSEGSPTGRSDSVRGEGEEALLCIQFGRAIFQVECDLEKATAQIENRKAAKRADASIKEQALKMIFPTKEIYCRPLGDLGDKTKPARLATPEEIMEAFSGDADQALVTLLNKGHILPPSSDQRKARLVLQGWSASGNKVLLHAECNYADAVAERRRLRDYKTVSPLSSNELDQIFKGTAIYSHARAKVPAREQDLLREFGTTERTAILEEMLNYGYIRRDLMEASLHASEFDLVLDAMEVDGARMGFKRAFKSLYVKHNSNDNVLVEHLKATLFASNMRLVVFKKALQGLIDHIEEIRLKHQSPPNIFSHPCIFRNFAKSSPPHPTEEEKQNGAKGRAWLEYLCLYFWGRQGTGRDAVIKRYRFSSSESDSDTNQNLLSRIRNCRPSDQRYTNHSLLVNDLKESNEFFWRNLCKISNADSEGKRLAGVFTLSGKQTTREHYESGVLFFQCREAELPPSPEPRFEGWRNRPMDSLLAYMEGTIRCTRDRGERDPETFHQILEVESKIPEIAKNLLFCCSFWNLAGEPRLLVQDLLRLTAPLARLDPFEGEPQRAAECLLRGSPRGAGAGDSLPEPRFEALRDAGLQRSLLVSLLTSPCLPLTDAERYLAIRCLYWEPYYFERVPPRKAGPPRDQATLNDHPAPSTLDYPALKPSASVSSICSSDEGSVGPVDEDPSELHLSREGRGLGSRRGGGQKWGGRGSPATRSPTPPPSHFGPSGHDKARFRLWTADPPAQPVFKAEGKAGNGIRVGAGGAKYVPHHLLRPAANDKQHKGRTSYRVSDANTPRPDGLGCLRKKD